MARDFGRADRLRREREQRDEVARAAHEAAVAAAPHEDRLLVRARDGELVSYTREEFGVGRRGLGPTISSWKGYAVGSVVLLGLALLPVVALVHDLVVGSADAGSWQLLAISALSLPGFAYYVHLLRKERRAELLRRSRGLPRPSE